MASSKLDKGTGKVTTASGNLPKAGPKSRNGKKKGGVSLMPKGSDILSQARNDREQDRIEIELEHMEEALLLKMASSAPSDDTILKEALKVFQDSYRTTTQQTLRRAGTYRDQHAIKQAVATIGDAQLADYARRSLIQVCKGRRLSKSDATRVTTTSSSTHVPKPSQVKAFARVS